MLNLELLERVRDKVLFEPDSHKQETWMTVEPEVVANSPMGMPGGWKAALVSCPTTGCVAGWASALSGDLAVVFVDDDYEYNHPYEVEEIQTAAGEVMAIEDRAMDLLGLSLDQASALFHGENSRDNVLAQLDGLIAEAKEQRNHL